MIKAISPQKPFRKRLSFKQPLTPQQIEEEQSRLNRFRHRCQLIFERVKPQFMETHYNWYLAVEPDSGDYFLAEDDLEAGNLCRQKHPLARIYVFRINETGACGTIC